MGIISGKLKLIVIALRDHQLEYFWSTSVGYKWTCLSENITSSEIRQCINIRCCVLHRDTLTTSDENISRRKEKSSAPDITRQIECVVHCLYQETHHIRGRISENEGHCSFATTLRSLVESLPMGLV